MLEAKESDDQEPEPELENMSIERDLGETNDDESIEEFSWDGLLIEDDDEDIYCSQSD